MGTAPRKGFNLARSVGSAGTNGGLNAYKIASGYAVALGVGDPVKLTTDGTVIKAANSAGNLGVIRGIQYTDSQGDIKITKYWPASTTATNIEVLVGDNPLSTYHVQADGPIPEAVCFPGVMYAMNLSAADSATGRSTDTVNSIPVIVGDVDMSGYTTPVGDGSSTDADAFTIETTDPDNAAVTVTIATATTMTELLAAMTAVTGITATLDGTTGFLTIVTTDGYLINMVDTVGTFITDYFATASPFAAAGTKVVAIASSMVKVVSIPDRDNKVMEVALTLTDILADS